MRYIFLAVGILVATAATLPKQAKAETKAAPEPILFQPESAWPDGDDSAPAFTPDGKTVFFTHRAGTASIMMATSHDGIWSKPQVAPFSGKWRDIEPSIAPDGSYLVFVSNRPAKGDGEPLTGYFGGRSQPGLGGNIWRVDRRGDGWGEPVRLPDIINSSSAIYSPAVAGDGSIYFNQPDSVTKKSHVYRAQARRDGFEAPVALSISDGTHPGYDVAVAPDESFLVFSSGREPAPKDQSLLFVAFKRNGKWTEPQALDPHLVGLESRFSPDLKTLYFEADQTIEGKTHGRIFQIPLHAYIRLAAGVATPMTLDGIIHPDTDDTLAFTPDGNTVFFDRSEGPHKTVMIAHRIASHWAKPEVASFSGQWFDQNPVVSPDGSYVLFNSDRPTQPGGKPLTQNYFGGGVTAPGSNIWRIDRTANGWGKPVRLGTVVNSDVFIDFASIAGDNTLYFMRWNADAKAMHFWRSVYKRGQYQSPERVILGEPSETLHDPAVAPDQSFIVFDSGRVKGGLGRLSIAFRDGEHWGKPIDLGDDLNKDLPWGPHLAPDGHSVYVTGNSGIWRILLDPWLRGS